ncbi:MAG: MBL fold metallo-hydrolase [Clostridia bacterium]|nr:MBL fold metallo-hydrolase [Clostridia bacterium]
MRVIKKKTIYQLTFLPRFFPVNCYLVEEEDGLTLVDAGLPYSWRGILKQAEEIKKPINHILLTHVHGDHVGSLDRLKEVLPAVPVYVSRRDARLMGGDLTLDKGEPNLPIRGDVPKNLITRADILLEEGDRVGSLITISTPGHTPGSVSYLDTRNNSLIVGDAFQTRGGIAVGGQMRPLFPFPAMATWNPALALESAKKLKTYRPALLACGHGKMLADPETEMSRVIEDAEQDLKKIMLETGK